MILFEIGITNHKVRVVETVNNVPTKLLKLLPLEKDGVEEAEREQETSVLISRLAHMKLLLGYQLVEALEIGLQPLKSNLPFSTHSRL